MTPVFQASYSGLFKTFVDVLDDGSLRGTPVLMAATAGTARHSLVLEHAMRPMFSYLKAVTVPTGVFAASEDWGADGTVDAGLSGRIGVAAGRAGRPAHRRPAQRPSGSTSSPTPCRSSSCSAAPDAVPPAGADRGHDPPDLHRQH